MIVVIYCKECGCDVGGMEYIDDCVAGVKVVKDVSEGKAEAKKLLEAGFSKVELWSEDKLLKVFR